MAIAVDRTAANPLTAVLRTSFAAVGIVARANQEDRLVQAMALIERVLDLGILIPTFTK
jgi:hypothetical protein